MNVKRFLVKPGSKVHLEDFDPGATPGFKDKQDAADDLARNLVKLAALQEMLYAQGSQALLVVLQGMDTSGKDGAIEHVMGAFNPQGVQITAFKVPTSEELAHDFLWRVHKAAPPRGMVGIFNRSHYEDVLVVRVAKLAPKTVWGKRFDHINDFEKLLSENGVRIVKLLPAHLPRGAGRATDRAPGHAREAVEVQPRRPQGPRPVEPVPCAPTRTSSGAARRRGRRGTWCRPTASGTATWWSPRCSSTLSKDMNLAVPAAGREHLELRDPPGGVSPHPSRGQGTG